MKNILTALGLSSVTTIGISVSASNIIEMICIDKDQRMITKYACKELKYNNAIREIINYDDFATVVQELFKEIGVNPKDCYVILNLPNVHFSFVSLPLVLPDEQITTAISSEVEEMYLFKRHEPVVSWNTVTVNKDTEKRYIVYGAVQENTIQNIKDIFEELGVKLVAVETANSSMIKGIIYSRVLEEEFANNDTINILLISSNSYSIFCMQGKKLVDYYEEPLAIKSFSSDEVYVAISSAASNAIENYPAQDLLIVSETHEVSAEILCHKINFEGNIKYLDRNMYADKSFMEISTSILPKYLPVISLEAVGAAAYTYDAYPLKFNFLLGTEEEESTVITLHIMGQDYEIARKALLNIGSIAGVAVLCILLLISFLISLYDKKLYKEINLMSEEFIDVRSQISATEISGDVNDIYNLSRDMSEQNQKQIDLLFGLGAEIPSDVYLTNFFCNTEGMVIIEGNANSSESIYAYMKGLKNRYPDIKMSKLQLAYGGEDGSKSVYSFLIENATPVQPANPENQNPDGNNPNNPPQDNQNANQPSGFMNNMFPSQQAPQAPQSENNPPAPAPNAPAGLPAPAAP
ncbi:MAG: hypothetical protein ACI37Z_00740 [Candidatus Gastranaerophilaceae bacterium]